MASNGIPLPSRIMRRSSSKPLFFPSPSLLFLQVGKKRRNVLGIVVVLVVASIFFLSIHYWKFSNVSFGGVTGNENNDKEKKRPSVVLWTDELSLVSSLENNALLSSTVLTEHSHKDSLNHKRLCEKAVDRFLQLNINLVALDFDLTILDIHTGGRAKKSHTSLVDHIRPQIKCLMESSLQKGLYVGVASFSIQEELIKRTIHEAISMGHNVTVHGGRNHNEPDGKRQQLEAVMSSIRYQNNQKEEGMNGGNESNKVVSPSHTILIDDDENNIRKAKEDGFYALWFDPKNDNVQSFYDSIISLPVSINT